MDFVKLHEPYVGEDSPSPDAQLRWLTVKQGIPQDIAARAMLVVYEEIENGKKFEDGEIDGKKRSAGWILCQYLLSVSRELHKKAIRAYLDSLAEADLERRNKIKEKLLELQPKTFWQRVKAVVKDPYKKL